MSATTSIEWTDATWNPVTGCTQVSPGCAHCYAQTFAERFRGVEGHYFERGFDVELRPQQLDLPLRWRRPRRIFVNSMSDLFHEQVPDRYIDQVLAVMVLCQAFGKGHVFQVLTKRAERMAAYFAGEVGADAWSRRLADAAEEVFGEGRDCDVANSITGCLGAGRNTGWPLANLWLGVSVENQRHAYRAALLCDVPAAVRFVSAEPLLGPVTLAPVGVHAPGSCGCESDAPWCPYADRRIDWVIVGGESGPGARPMALEWARALRDECRAAGTAFFLKQLGGHPDKRGAAAAVLDGERWTQMPEAARV